MYIIAFRKCILYVLTCACTLESGIHFPLLCLLAPSTFSVASADILLFFPSFHNKLKNNPRYLNHSANRRCDDLIEVLLAFEEDLFHERMRKDVMLSPTCHYHYTLTFQPAYLCQCHGDQNP